LRARTRRSQECSLTPRTPAQLREAQVQGNRVVECVDAAARTGTIARDHSRRIRAWLATSIPPARTRQDLGPSSRLGGRFTDCRS
jgi:hypothetical protein